MLLRIQDTALANEGPQTVGIGIAVSKTEHLEYDEAESMSTRDNPSTQGIVISVVSAPSQTFNTDRSAAFTIESFC